MTRRSLVACILLARLAPLGVPVAAQSGASGVEGAVLSAQARWFDAYAGCKTQEMPALLADGMMFIHHMGRAETKTEFLKGHASCGVVQIGSEGTKVRVFGDTAIVTGHLTFRLKNAEGKGSFASPTSSASFSTFQYGEVFVRQNGTWLLAQHQSTATPLPEQAH